MVVMKVRREFAIALQFVRQKYPDLFQCAEFISTVPADYFPAGQLGQCSGDNFISIKDTPATVSDFVDTLVHELTHARQNRTNSTLSSLQREEEAYAAGIKAAVEYMREAAPWVHPII
jgi:hypothetical protein